MYENRPDLTQDDAHISLLLDSQFQGICNNKLLDLSLPILLLATRLSKISALNNEYIADIKETFANQVLAISSTLSAMRCYEESDLIKMRYCLCVFIDEMLLRNESILNSQFARNTLTIRLFDEMLGGDKFYGIAGQYMLNPSKYKDMLEFIYTCLILGYKGKYANQEQGEEKLIHLCNDIAAAIAPILDSSEEVAFELARNHTMQPKTISILQKRNLRSLFLFFIIGSTILTFCFSIFQLETHNAMVQESIMQNIDAVMQGNKER